MSLIPCDFCHKRVVEKLCQATTAWYGADGNRVAYRQRLCTTCYATNILSLDKPVDIDSLKCPSCGISTEHDMDAMYATVYIPGAGRQQFEFPMCPSCGAELRARAMEGGTRLENRGGVEGPESGPSTPSTREAYWQAVSVRPGVAPDAL
jgi:ribosomal protein S27AE